MAPHSATLLPGKKPLYPLDRRLGGTRLVWMLWSREKFPALAGNRTSAIQPVARCYTDKAIPCQGKNISMLLGWFQTYNTTLCPDE
jgi:hypothetical protein